MFGMDSYFPFGYDDDDDDYYYNFNSLFYTPISKASYPGSEKRTEEDQELINYAKELVVNATKRKRKE